MPVHMTNGRQLPPFGVGPPLGFGFVAPAAQQLGLGAMSRSFQPDRLRVVDAPPASANPMSRFEYRLMDPRTLDATRILDAGAPAVRQLYEIAPFPFRRTEAPQRFQNTIAMGGRHVLVLPPTV
jgi:hypothetical protein